MDKSKWGDRWEEDWKELGVNSIRGWSNKVKDRRWLASKLERGRKKKKREEEGGLENIVLHRKDQCECNGNGLPTAGR